MKTVTIGASGIADHAATQALSRKHEVVRVGRTQGDYQVNITSQKSVKALFEKVGRVDAIVPATGNLLFRPLSTVTDQDFNQELQGRLLGQIHLALTGQHFLNDDGSITLISGIIAHEPIAQGTNAATISTRLGGFVRATACELGHSQRINPISPTVLNESAEACDSFFPGFENVPATTVANAYRRSVGGARTGRIYKISY